MKKTLRPMTLVGIMLAVTLAVACHRDNLPEGVLDEKTLTAVLTEMHTADAYFNVTTGYECDTLIGEINYTYNQIFKKHGTTKEAFDKSMDYYYKQPKKFRAIYEKVVLNLNKK